MCALIFRSDPVAQQRNQLWVNTMLAISEIACIV